MTLDLPTLLAPKVATGADLFTDWFHLPADQWPAVARCNCWTPLVRSGVNLPGRRKFQHRGEAIYETSTHPTALLRVKGKWVNMRRAMVELHYANNNASLPTNWRATYTRLACRQIGCLNPLHIHVVESEIKTPIVPIPETKPEDELEILDAIEEIEMRIAMDGNIRASEFRHLGVNYSEATIRTAYIRANLTHLLDI